MAPRAERSALRSWFYGYAPPERGVVVLGHRRVYIVPTRLGLLFGGTLAIQRISLLCIALRYGRDAWAEKVAELRRRVSEFRPT